MADYAIGTTFSFKFTTKKNGVATSLSGGTVVAYVGNSTTEITAGITLTADFDGVTGLNDVTVVATSGNGYTASDVTFVLTAGTLGGTAVYPATVGEFTFERESALRPTVAGRTIDITATGEAGIDWANVGSPTTTLNLSGTTVATLTNAPSDSSGVTTLLSRLTSGRASNLDNLDLAISAVLTTAMTESYNADGVAPTPAQALFVIMQRLTEMSISGTSLTVKKLDGSTTAYVLTLDDSVSPTSSTRTA